MELNQVVSNLRAALSHASSRAGEVRRLLAGSEQWQFLRHYARLRLDVLRGRRTATQPLGLRPCWRRWQYEQYMRRIKERQWLS